MIIDHCINYNHNFSWKDVKILDKKSLYNKRLISEMVHIKKQKLDLNKQNDTEALPNSYLQILQLPTPS